MLWPLSVEKEEEVEGKDRKKTIRGQAQGRRAALASDKLASPVLGHGVVRIGTGFDVQPETAVIAIGNHTPFVVPNGLTEVGAVLIDLLEGDTPRVLWTRVP